MNLDKFEKIINEAFDIKEKINANSDKSIIDAIKETIELTDKGKVRVAEKKKWFLGSQPMGKKSNTFKF